MPLTRIPTIPISDSSTRMINATYSTAPACRRRTACMETTRPISSSVAVKAVAQRDGALVNGTEPSIGWRSKGDPERVQFVIITRLLGAGPFGTGGDQPYLHRPHPPPGFGNGR